MTRVRTTTVRSAIENYHMSAAQKELISASLRDARLALSIGRQEEFAEILSNPHNPREVGRHWAERSAMLIATASVEYRAIEDHAATKALNRSAAQVGYLGNNNPNFTSFARHFSCYVFDYGYWCSVPPYQGTTCSSTLSNYKLVPLVNTGQPLGSGYNFYEIENYTN